MYTAIFVCLSPDADECFDVPLNITTSLLAGLITPKSTPVKLDFVEFELFEL